MRSLSGGGPIWPASASRSFAKFCLAGTIILILQWAISGLSDLPNAIGWPTQGQAGIEDEKGLAARTELPRRKSKAARTFILRAAENENDSVGAPSDGPQSIRARFEEVPQFSMAAPEIVSPITIIHGKRIFLFSSRAPPVA